MSNELIDLPLFNTGISDTILVVAKPVQTMKSICLTTMITQHSHPPVPYHLYTNARNVCLQCVLRSQMSTNWDASKTSELSESRCSLNLQLASTSTCLHSRWKQTFRAYAKMICDLLSGRLTIFETITASRFCSYSMIIKMYMLVLRWRLNLCHLKFPKVLLAHILAFFRWSICIVLMSVFPGQAYYFLFKSVHI